MGKLGHTSFTLKNGKQIIFRHLTIEDAERFLEFRAQTAHDSTHTMHYVGMTFPSVEETAKRLQSQEEDQFDISIGAFDNNKVIAWMSFRLIWGNHPWTSHHANFGMMVLKEYWGQGIGKKLLDLQEQHARQVGITRIEAMVRVQNKRGVKLYENNGFKIEGTRRKAAKIDGEYQDEYYIAKILDDVQKSWTAPELKTERLILRPVELSDAKAIFNYAKNPNVSRYTLWEPHQSISDSVNYIQEYVFHYYKKGVPEPLGITLKESPQTIIGTVGCFWVSQASKSMELAYALDENFWGKGIAAEASIAIMDYCFKEYKLKRIQARCKSENKASAKVMEKIGMTYEGTFKAAIHHRNRYWDMHYYAKIAESN